MAAFALGVVVAPVLGPTLGGWLTDQYTWRWAFYINIPIGVVATFLIMRFVKDPPYIQNAKPGKIDGIGLGLLAVWIGTLQVILDKGQEDDWFGAIWIRWAAAVLVIARGLPRSRTGGQESNCEPEDLQRPEFCDWLYFDRMLRSRHIRCW